MFTTLHDGSSSHVPVRLSNRVPNNNSIPIPNPITMIDLDKLVPGGFLFVGAGISTRILPTGSFCLFNCRTIIEAIEETTRADVMMTK